MQKLLRKKCVAANRECVDSQTSRSRYAFYYEESAQPLTKNACNVDDAQSLRINYYEESAQPATENACTRRRKCVVDQSLTDNAQYRRRCLVATHKWLRRKCVVDQSPTENAWIRRRCVVATCNLQRRKCVVAYRERIDSQF